MSKALSCIYTPASKKNKLECEYEQHLIFRRNAGEVLAYRFEGLKFRLADRTTYTPDFVVILPTHTELHEVKGFWREDARVKIRVAAEQWPWFRWCGVRKVKGAWQWEWFN